MTSKISSFHVIFKIFPLIFPVTDIISIFFVKNVTLFFKISEFNKKSPKFDMFSFCPSDKFQERLLIPSSESHFSSSSCLFSSTRRHYHGTVHFAIVWRKLSALRSRLETPTRFVTSLPLNVRYRTIQQKHAESFQDLSPVNYSNVVCCQIALFMKAPFML